MPVLNDRNAGIFNITIYIGDHFNLTKEDYFVTLREPTMEETIILSKSGVDGTNEIDNAKVFQLVPSCIIDHNFELAEGKKMATLEVWKEIMRRPVCSTEVVEQWSSNIPLAKKKSQSSVD